VERAPRHPILGSSVRVLGLLLVLSGVTDVSLASAVGATPSAHASQRFVISTTQDPRLGTILVNSGTLYTSNMATCTGTCLKYWPQVLLPKGVTTATAGSGVNAALLGTIKRAGGRLQVTYAGKPLYRFVNDKKPGQVKVNNVTDAWGTWSVATTQTLGVVSPPPTSTPPAAPLTEPTTTAPPPTTIPPTSAPPAPPAAPTTTAPPPTTVPPTAPTTTQPKPTTTTTAPSSGGTSF
jgi:predicted lipoprotein with Yx(FWY)xxD motif